MGKVQTNSEKLMLDSLIQFYKQGSNLKKLVDIIVVKKYRLPISLFDWFVTTYAKENIVYYTIKRPDGAEEIFKPHDSYENQLRSFSKKNFDPFCRGGDKSNIQLQYTDTENGEIIQFETSIRQMKFFRWAIENLLVDYIYQHRENLIDLMHKSKSQKIKKQSHVVTTEITN